MKKQNLKFLKFIIFSLFLVFFFVSITPPIYANNETVIDLTDSAIGGDVNHTHITQREYDANYHWERCWKCNKIVNKVAHSLITTGESYCSSTVPSQVVYCTSGCGYSYTLAKPAHTPSDYRPLSDRPCCNIYCTTCGNWLATPRCKNSAGQLIGCDSVSGTCVTCGRYWDATQHAYADAHDYTNADQTAGYIHCTICGKRFGTYTMSLDNTSYENKTIHTFYITPYAGFQITSDPVAGNCGGLLHHPTYSSNGYWSGSTYVVRSEVTYDAECLPNTICFHDHMYYTYGSTNQWIHLRGKSVSKTDNWAPRSPQLTAVGSGQVGNFSVKGTITASFVDWNSANNVVYMRLLDKDKTTVLTNWGAASRNGGTYTRIFDVCAEIREPSNLYIQAKDACGNISIIENGTVQMSYIDTLAPRLTSGTASDTAYSQSKTITYTTLDAGSGDVQIAFNETSEYKAAVKNGDNYSRTYTFIGDVNGTKEAALYMKDRLGNDRMVRVKISNLDNTKPTMLTLYNNLDKGVGYVGWSANDYSSRTGQEGSKVKGYYYVLDNNPNTIVTTSNGTYTTATTLSYETIGEQLYIHVAAIDNVGLISDTKHLTLTPITYYLKYNSNTALNKGVADVEINDDRRLVFKYTYPLKANTFTNNVTGYYGQELYGHFTGWSFTKFSSFAPATNNPYKYAGRLLNALDRSEFYTTTSEFGSHQFITDAQKNTQNYRIYFYDNEEFKNLTTYKNYKNITLYANWVMDNQRPYGGFAFKTFVYNDDGTNTKTLKNVSSDSYDIGNFNDVSKTITLYNDNVYFLNTQYRDPEGNTCTVEYQYSIDGGKTWYKLGNSIKAEHQTHFNVANYSTSSGTLLGLTFKENKTTLLRMRVKDAATYPTGYYYNTSTKTYETKELQKSMWSTGYFVYNDRNDYDENGKYLGDYGEKANQGGAWYTKTINGKVGNQKPTTGLVGDDLDVSGLNGNYTYEGVKEAIKNQNFFNIPMYDYTKSGETFDYGKGTLYFLLPNHLLEGVESGNELSVFYNKDNAIYNYIKDTTKTFLTEDYYQYTDFVPEDESVAFLNASSDKDGVVVGNDGFAHYWIAICEKGDNKNVLVTKNDVATSYTSLNTSNATLYAKTINGVVVQGLIYDSYEQMVKDIYDRSGALFATHGDNEINMYDIYFSVCDKSWNDISPNKWGGVVRKTLITEPMLSFYDVQFKDKNSTIGTYENFYSLYKNDSLPFYYIGGYTLESDGYKNLDNTFASGTNADVTLKTLYNNAKQNYVRNTDNFVSINGAIPIRLGYNLDLVVTTHGNEKTYVTIYDENEKSIAIIQAQNDKSEIVNNAMVKNSTRKGENNWYHNSLFSFAVPEQSKESGYYMNITIEKIPYTNPSKTLTRSIYVGDKNDLLFTNNKTSLDDVGVHITD